MAKLPVMGRVKSRLGREVGQVVATSFYRHAMARVVWRLSRDPRWRTIVAVMPDTAIGAAAWPGAVARMRQGQGDLGRRMQAIMDDLPPGPAVIVGTDIPAIEPRHVAEAFRALGRSDAVLGPAGDGGYWLIGFKRCPRIPRPFARVRWSSAHACADTMCGLAGWSTSLVTELRDIDDRAAYVAGCGLSGRLVRGGR